MHYPLGTSKTPLELLLEGFSYFLFLKCDSNVTHLGLLLFSSLLKKEVPEGNEPIKFDISTPHLPLDKELKCYPLKLQFRKEHSYCALPLFSHHAGILFTWNVVLESVSIFNYIVKIVAFWINVFIYSIAMFFNSSYFF